MKALPLSERVLAHRLIALRSGVCCMLLGFVLVRGIQAQDTSSAGSTQAEVLRTLHQLTNVSAQVLWTQTLQFPDENKKPESREYVLKAEPPTYHLSYRYSQLVPVQSSFSEADKKAGLSVQNSGFEVNEEFDGKRFVMFQTTVGAPERVASGYTSQTSPQPMTPLSFGYALGSVPMARALTVMAFNPVGTQEDPQYGTLQIIESRNNGTTTRLFLSEKNGLYPVVITQEYTNQAGVLRKHRYEAQGLQLINGAWFPTTGLYTGENWRGNNRLVRRTIRFDFSKVVVNDPAYHDDLSLPVGIQLNDEDEGGAFRVTPTGDLARVGPSRFAEWIIVLCSALALLLVSDWLVRRFSSSLRRLLRL